MISQILWTIFARLLVLNKRLVYRLVQRAKKTPYTPIKSRDGSTIYMERYWLFNPYTEDEFDAETKRWSWLPSVRIHRIRRADDDAHHHDHPWHARTIVLQGYYIEERLHPTDLNDVQAEFPRSDGYTGCLNYGEFHRISEVSIGGAWTMFITWRKQGSWGFDVDGKKVHWKTYLGVNE